MTPGATAIDPCIRMHRGLEVFVPEKLSHGFKPAGLIIEQNFRAQMTSLVRGQRDACPPSRIIGNQDSKSFFGLRSAIDINEQSRRTFANDFRRDAVAIFNE